MWELMTKVSQDEGQPSTAPWLDTKYYYDDVNDSTGYVAGQFHNLQQEVISGSNLPTSVYPVTKKWSYKTNYQTSSGHVTAYTVDTATHSETDDASGHVWQCQDTTYDEGAPSGTTTPLAGWPTTQKSYTTCGNSATALTSYTAYDQYGNLVATVDPLAAANPSLYSNHACGMSTPAYVSSAWTAGHYTTCTYYDTGHSAALPTLVKNARNQSITTNYDYTTQAGAVSSTVDMNGQPTSYTYSYDSTGNQTIQTKAPNPSGSYTSQQSEHTTCTANSALPCYEIDTNTSLYSTAITRTFYDQLGRPIETITPGPTPGDDTVQITQYFDEDNSVWQSVPFQVTARSSWLDRNGASDISGNPLTGTLTFADALGRTFATQDPNFGSTQEPGQTCSWRNGGTKYTSCTNYGQGTAVSDSTTYEMAMSTDADGHVTQSFTDVAGNVRDTQTNYGLATGTLSLGEQVKTQYNALSKPISVTTTDGRPQSGESTTSVTTTMTYDDTGRLLTVNDPDQGTFTYTYDPDGHVLSVVQASGSSSRTMGYNYDLLGRTVCVQTAAPVISWNGACSGGNSLIQNTYDTTVLGVQGTTDYPVGQLTQSIATTYYPDGSSGTVTEQFQHDQRQRLTNEQIQLGLPSSWNVSAGLPTYQEALSYNDANQVTTTSTTEGSAGYSFTSVYDPTNGVQQGLSNNSLSTANLATVSYNEYAQLSGITLLNGASSSPTSVASEQYGYDADQRPTTLSASWLPGSGNSGQIVGQSRSYDNQGNVITLATTFAPIPGQTGSGGAQTENFCYDEQNRLVWSGNSGTQPGSGTGTCGSSTLNSTLTNSGYTAPYVYTNLGQVWQGPLNHRGSQEQYLYCNSNAPHQLTGIYPLGTTCATMSSATPVYNASYDPWGNETTRTTGGVTATLSYDASNLLTEWNAGASSQEFYLYDALGNRILKRSITGTGTTLAIYSFGLEENDYTGTGVLTTQTHYYNLAGHLIGSFDGANTTFYMTDALGSVLTAFGQSAIEGEQIYGPFGASSYQSGLINTAKGYTGQVHDGVSGLYYYVARYYDPVIGMFLSVDTMQGNMQGMDPYSYTSNNPETKNDPSGHWDWGAVLTVTAIAVVVAAVVIVAPVAAPLVIAAAAETAAGVIATVAAGTAAVAAGGSAIGAGLGVSGAITLGYAAYVLGPDMDAAAADANAATAAAADDPCEEGLSFAPNTLVATDHGEQAIGTLKVGELVWSYNPQTHRMELEPIQKIWLNHDSDLVDLTLTAIVKGVHGKKTQQKETLHTNERHPFLTEEHGFIPVSQLKPGMHVLEANGHYGIVAKLVNVPGSLWMYNLTVTQDHTYTVGVKQWIVHNVDGPGCINNNELGNKARSAANQSTSKVKVGAASNARYTNTGNNVTAFNGSPVENIGDTAAETGLYHGCCAETNIFAKIIAGLKNGTITLAPEENGILKVIVGAADGRAPCGDCLDNAAIFAAELRKGDFDNISVFQFLQRYANGSINPEPISEYNIGFNGTSGRGPQ